MSDTTPLAGEGSAEELAAGSDSGASVAVKLNYENGIGYRSRDFGEHDDGDPFKKKPEPVASPSSASPVAAAEVASAGEDSPPPSDPASEEDKASEAAEEKARKKAAKKARRKENERKRELENAEAVTKAKAAKAAAQAAAQAEQAAAKAAATEERERRASEPFEEETVEIKIGRGRSARMIEVEMKVYADGTTELVDEEVMTRLLELDLGQYWGPTFGWDPKTKRQFRYKYVY